MLDVEDVMMNKIQKHDKQTLSFKKQQQFCPG